MAQNEDIMIDQGADVAIQLELLEKDGSIKNLVGYSSAATMKRSYNADSDNTLAFTTSVTELNAPLGVLVLELTNTQTDTLKPGRWLYDVEISYQDSDGNTIVERVLEGNIEVSPSITR